MQTFKPVTMNILNYQVVILNPNKVTEMLEGEKQAKEQQEKAIKLLESTKNQTYC